MESYIVSLPFHNFYISNFVLIQKNKFTNLQYLYLCIIFPMMFPNIILFITILIILKLKNKNDISYSYPFSYFIYTYFHLLISSQRIKLSLIQH